MSTWSSSPPRPRDRPRRHGAFPARRRTGADATLAWAHFGASLACFGSASRRRALGHRSPGRHPPAPGAELAGDGGPGGAALPRIAASRRWSGARAGIGELRDVQAAGYPRFFGMAGSTPSSTRPPIRPRRPDRRFWNRSSGRLRRPLDDASPLESVLRSFTVHTPHPR